MKMKMEAGSIKSQQQGLNPVINKKPRLCFIGSLLGRNKGYVTTQGEILSGLFQSSGYDIISASSQINKFSRLHDIMLTLISSRDDYDIAVIDVYGGASFIVEDIASKLCKLLGKKIVFILHGGGLPEFVNRHVRWCRLVFERAHAIVAPSNFLARTMGLYGFSVRVIPNVINLQSYPHRHRRNVKPKLFWMRQFHPIWNPLLAVKVLASLRESVPEATLVMAGADKGMLEEVRTATNKLGVSGHVNFSGFLDHDGKAREGSLNDIFINTNHIDNMPVAVVEACAMGLPVVSTNVGGIPDLLKQGETGMLVPDDNVNSMVEAIKELLDNPQLAGRLSRNGRVLAEQSSWEVVRPSWQALFDELLMNKGIL
jgi:glycosyltransferase involved in cell wall biosynthesis